MNCQDVKRSEGGGNGFIELDFALQTPDHVLDLPTGKLIFLLGDVHGEMVMRGYTPITSEHDVGRVQFVIKAYPPFFLSGDVNGEMVVRRYIPITSDHDVGRVKFVIETYPPCERFSLGGYFLSTSTPSRSGVPSACAVRLASSTITATASS